MSCAAALLRYIVRNFTQLQSRLAVRWISTGDHPGAVAPHRILAT